MEINEAEKILNIKKESDLNDIKEKYRILVKQYHPDRIGNNDMIYKINKAFELIESYKESNIKYQSKKENSNKENYNEVNNIENVLLNTIKNNIFNYDKNIVEIFKGNYKIIDIVIKTILNKTSNHREIVTSMYNGLKEMYKKIGKKFTQKNKYQIIKLIIDIYKLNINIDEMVDILGIKKEKVNDKKYIEKENIKIILINAICSYEDYIKLFQKKQFNIKIKIANNDNIYDKLINLKYLWQDCEKLFIICIDNNGNTYKLEYMK